MSPDHETLRWIGGPDGRLVLLDQTRLPLEIREVTCRDVGSLWEAIRSLRVRGAPAIGIAAAYGVVLGLQQADPSRPDRAQEGVEQVVRYLESSRPTAVNLFWALRRMEDRARRFGRGVTIADLRAAMLEEARSIHEEDRAVCHALGRLGATLLSDVTGVLTHCNAGGLATSEYGTALAAIYTAHAQGKQLHVFVGETRPLLQGARLTAWELTRQGIDTTLICDSMAAQVMREGRVQAVITGADRIAANGDTANKIGTYSLAVLAAAHKIPFYIAAPRSTFDLTLPDGDAIPIEQRDHREVTHGLGRQTAPEGIQVYNPAFDVTPARLIHTIVTERELIHPVTTRRIRQAMANPAPPVC
jgi:methylthioribose-1-phosphate isomerase